MFSHLLVPLDGSRRAEQALSVAARLARVSEGTITLVQAIHGPREMLLYGTETPLLLPETLEERIETSKSYLEHLRQRHDLQGLTVQTLVILGDPAEAIPPLAAVGPVDLIVLTSHGYTGVKRRLLGSVAELIARHTSAPMLILREGEPLHIHHDYVGTSFVHVLMPFDPLDYSFAEILPAVEIVRSLSTPGQGEVHLSQMIVSSEPMSREEQDALLQPAREKLGVVGQSIRKRLRSTYAPATCPILTWSVSLERERAAGIVHMAEYGYEQEMGVTSGKSDVLVLTMHHSGEVPEWALGNLSEHVLHATRLPVLVVHQGEEARESTAGAARKEEIR